MTIRDLCVVDWGNTDLTKSAYVEDGKFLAVSAAGCDGRIDHKEHSRHTPVLSAIGAQCGKMFFPDEDFTAIKNTITLTPRSGRCHAKFLYYLLTFVKLPQRGAGQPFIAKGDIQTFGVSSPDVTEQRRIVGILDEAFRGIATAKANAENNLENARALFESALDVAIEGKLVPQNSRDTAAAELVSHIEKARNAAIAQGRAKPEKAERVGAKNENQVALPNNWKWAHLESLTVGISDGVHKKPRYVSSGIPFITVKNLTKGPGISFDDLNYISQEDHDEFVKRTRPQKGDILITKDGTIGVVRLIETDLDFSIFVSVALIKPVIPELGPYLVYALRASCVQNQIVPQGAALKHLYLVDLRRLAVPLPPLSEQKRIIARLDALKTEAERLESICKKKLAALEALKKSLLHEAFTGQL